MRILRIVSLALVAVPATLAAQATPAATVRLASLSSGAAVPVVDSAIDQLEGFLQRHPASPLRANALFQLGELLVRRADEQFAAAQRTTTGDSSSRAARPDYTPAIARYEELVARFPQFERRDAAAYTLGTLYAQEQRWPDAARMFETVVSSDSSRFRPEAYFRLGDARFELANKERGDRRRALYAQASQAYEKAAAAAPAGGDIHFLSLYKLGWAYYNQAGNTQQDEYKHAVDTFGTLVDDYDKLTAEQQSRLGLRGEAIEYMAIAFTQVGGSEAANSYFSKRGGTDYKVPVLRRVAQSLRDQGDFPRAVIAYQTLLREAPGDSTALAAQREVIDIYQNRMLEPDSAQIARLALVEKFGPESQWAKANPGSAADLAKAREDALRQSGQYLLASAQSGNKARYAEASTLYAQYLNEFGKGDSSQVVNRYYAEALFGQGDYAKAGEQFVRTAYDYQGTDSLAQQAGRNAIVAYDSALVKSKTDKGAQDAFFGSVDRFVDKFPQSDLAKKALIQKGRRASETQRWDVMAETFKSYASRYPNDDYTPTAQRLIGEAMYRGGDYTSAQAQWEKAQQIALSSGRKALADSIGGLRTTAAASFADTLVKHGDYSRAAEEVYVAYADKNPKNAKAPDALRNAIETYVLADSVARAKGDNDASAKARGRVIELSQQLATNYPTYKYRQQYQVLRAQLLSDLGKRDESVTAYRELIAGDASWSGRADAMIRVAVMLDSLGNKKDAAAAYEQFATAYPKDQRAAGALYNAAATYAEGDDKAAAARTYATFAARFPRDERAAQARNARIELLRASGDSAGANAALASACSNPTADIRGECSARAARGSFERGMATYGRYELIALEIPTVKQLSAAGVKAASAQKQSLLRSLTADFAQAIKSGNPEYLAASTYYIGLAQWNYGKFLRDVKLPAGLSTQQEESARNGSAQQAEQFFTAAKKTWQELVDKAASDEALGKDDKARGWIDRAKNAADGKVDETPGGAGN
ncbi:MAG: Tetratricopeptide 2 repeat protein [Gemmatimonadetes bacterium]|nr:Tetratricopeptide 2 repeat protein [Gemmatimonadota bacterium]